jgi:hypothetical protein
LTPPSVSHDGTELIVEKQQNLQATTIKRSSQQGAADTCMGIPGGSGHAGSAEPYGRDDGKKIQNTPMPHVTSVEE